MNAIPSYDQEQFRLNEINEVKDYFVSEIREGEFMSERLSRYISFLNTNLLSH